MKTLKETMQTLQKKLDALNQEVKDYQDQAKMKILVIHNQLVHEDPSRSSHKPK